nr:hypothetical protein [uncultured Desulfobacter sp.]
MYQTGKGLTALILGPKGDKSVDLKIDDYDVVDFGLLMSGRGSQNMAGC